MKNLFLTVGIFSLLLAGCGEKSPLEEKRTELDGLKKELHTLQKQIVKLENEIALADSSAFQKRERLVELKKLKSEKFDHFVAVHGTVDAKQTVDVMSEVTGKISKLYVKEGQKVKKGQIVARISSAQLSQLEVSLANSEAQLELAEKLFKKQENLWNQKVGSEVAYLQAKTSKEALENSIAETKQQLSKASVYAPVSGTVDFLAYNEGEFATGMAPIARIVNSNDILIAADVSESLLGKISKGDAADVELPMIEKTIPGKVTAVGEFINSENRTFKVYIKPSAEGKGDLKPNVLSVVHFNDYSTESAFVVPSEAIQYDRLGNFVFTSAMGDGGSKIAKKVYITTGLTYKNQTEIFGENLKNGLDVLVKGQTEVVDGEGIVANK